MSALLFYFVGNSDVQLNGKRISEKFRDKTRELLETIKQALNEGKTVIRSNGFKVNNEEIEMPIFKSYLSFLKNELDDLTIYFIYTDQKPSHDQDTIYAYKILKSYAEKKYKSLEIKELCIDQDPSDWDKMAEFFKLKMQELKAELDTSLSIYISISPGTPASYVSFAMHLLDYDVKFIASKRENGESIAKEVSIFNKIKKENALDKIKILLDSYRYKNAIDFMSKSPLRYMKNIEPLLESLHYCLNEDFNSSMNKFKDLPEELKEKFKKYGRFISKIRKHDFLFKFQDLYWKIEIAKSCQQFVEFVALIFNFRENMVNYLLKEIGIGDPKKVKEYIKENDELKKKFDSKKLWYEKPSIPVIEEILSWKSEKDNNGKIKSFLDFSKFLNEAKQIDNEEISLSRLRNEGRFAHGGRATNEEILNIFGGVDNILKRISNLITTVFDKDIGLNKNIYKEVNEQIVKYVKDEII